MKFKIAVVQFDIKQFAPEENLKRAETFISEASITGAKVILFPEDFINGPILRKEQYADFDGKFKKVFQTLARKYSIDIVTGSFIEGEKGKLFNTTYYIDSKGKILGRYRKINLWIYERSYITSGDDIVVFNTKFGKVGLANCWDLSSPEIFRNLMKKGARIIFCPSYWLTRDARNGYKYDKEAVAKGIDAWCVARSFENEIILAYSNGAGKFRFGKKYEDNLVGHSQIVVPFRGAIAKLDHNKEGMIIQEVDTSVVSEAEKAFNIRKDIKNKTNFGKLSR